MIEEKRFLEIIRFCFAGGLGFLLDFILLYIFTEYFSINYLYSSAISFTVSVIFNYWLCLRFVFKGIKKQNIRQSVIFFGSSIIGLGINQICMWLLVDFVGIYYMIAKIISTAIVTIWNYIMKRSAIKN